METTTIVKSPTAQEMFHADIQEYHAPAGDVAPEVWKELDTFIWSQIYTWEAAKPGLAYSRHSYYLEGLRDRIGKEYLRHSSKAENYYVGTLAKRVAKYFRKVCNLAIPSTDLAKIGDLAARHASRQQTYFLDFDRELNWSAGDFGDHGSCFWSCRTAAREMMREHGAYAVRVWSKECAPWGPRTQGIGRAWIAPHKGLFFLFNAYGPLAQLPLARLICSRWGLTYIRVPDFRNQGATGGVLYVNDGATAFGAPEKIAALGDPVGRIELGWDEIAGYSCSSCECALDEDDCEHSPDGETLCHNCWSEYYFSCDQCGEVFCQGDSVDCGGDYYCPCCVERYGWERCQQCVNMAVDCTETEDGATCSDCMDEYQTCEECGDVRRFVNMAALGDEWFCNIIYHRCIEHVSTCCAGCGKRVPNDEIETAENRELCPDCIPEIADTGAAGGAT